jgi:DNA-binding NtrC family response regulator
MRDDDRTAVQLENEPEKRRQAESKQQAEAVSRALYVLLVSDKQSVHKLVAKCLLTEGHMVEIAASGRDGLEKFETGFGLFDVVVTDRVIPGMHGEQLAAAIKQLVPQQPVIMLTGDGNLMKAFGEHPTGVDAILGEPVTPAAFREALACITS